MSDTNVKITNDLVTIDFKIGDYVSDTLICDIIHCCQQLHGSVQAMHHPCKQSNNIELPTITADVPAKKSVSVSPKQVVMADERPMFRPRLQNSNEICLSDLKFEKAVTEQVQVRCPSCGQSSVLVIKDGTQSDLWHLMLFSPEKNEFCVVHSFQGEDGISSILLPKPEKKTYPELIQDYFEDLYSFLQSSPHIDLDVNVNNETTFLCPICGEKQTFMAWKIAYDSPLLYFETEHPCIYCGGEVCEIPQVKDGIAKSMIRKCERCNKIQPVCKKEEE